MADVIRDGKRSEKESLIEYVDDSTRQAGKCVLFVDAERGVAGIRGPFNTSVVYQVPLADLVELIRETL